MIAAVAESQLPAFGVADLKGKEVKGIVLDPKFRLIGRPGVPWVFSASAPCEHDRRTIKRKIKGIETAFSGTDVQPLVGAVLDFDVRHEVPGGWIICFEAFDDTNAASGRCGIAHILIMIHDVVLCDLVGERVEDDFVKIQQGILQRHPSSQGVSLHEKSLSVRNFVRFSQSNRRTFEL